MFKRLLHLIAEHHEAFLPEVLVKACRIERCRELITRYSLGRGHPGLDLGEVMTASMNARGRLLFGIREDRAGRGPGRLW